MRTLLARQKRITLLFGFIIDVNDISALTMVDPNGSSSYGSIAGAGSIADVPIAIHILIRNKKLILGTVLKEFFLIPFNC